MFPQDYVEAVGQFESLCKLSTRVSINTTNREVLSWQEQYGSFIFTRICLCSLATLRTLPGSSLYTTPFEFEVWDLPSVCTLTRSLLETYLVFRYLIMEREGDSSESGFRFVIWNLHSECERLEMLRLIGSQNPKIPELKADIEVWRDRLRKTEPFIRCSTKQKKKLLSGDIEIPPRRADVAEGAGIGRNYYAAMYKNLSNHAHTHPFSLGQTAAFSPNQSESVDLVKTTIDRAIGILSFSIRDFIKLFPDQGDSMTAGFWETLNIWEYVMSYEELIVIDRNPSAARLRHLSVDSWPVWEKEASDFSWHYETIETCYLLEGEVIVTSDGGEPIRFGKGDLVTFPKGMSCTWKVLKPIRKHYKFG